MKPGMQQQRTRFAAIAAAGVALFFGVVLALSLAQPGYDSQNQLMSELALGQHGQFLVIAFLALAAATGAVSLSLFSFGAPVAVGLLPAIAATSFVGAGLVSLGASIEIHVFFVAAAFILCGLSMCLLPIKVGIFSGWRYRAVCWGSFAAMLSSTALNGVWLSAGVAQRLAALALLVWLVLVAQRLSR
jgi:hypothetical protein